MAEEHRETNGERRRDMEGVNVGENEEGDGRKENHPPKTFKDNHYNKYDKRVKRAKEAVEKEEKLSLNELMKRFVSCDVHSQTSLRATLELGSGEEGTVERLMAYLDGFDWARFDPVWLEVFQVSDPEYMHHIEWSDLQNDDLGKSKRILIEEAMQGASVQQRQHIREVMDITSHSNYYAFSTDGFGRSEFYIPVETGYMGGSIVLESIRKHVRPPTMPWMYWKVQCMRRFFYSSRSLPGVTFVYIVSKVWRGTTPRETATSIPIYHVMLEVYLDRLRSWDEKGIKRITENFVNRLKSLCNTNLMSFYGDE
jgi:hypothetical protein